MTTPYKIRKEFRVWTIVNTETWNRELFTTLNPEQISLSPCAMWNDTLPIEILVNNWTLENKDNFQFLTFPTLKLQPIPALRLTEYVHDKDVRLLTITGTPCAL